MHNQERIISKEGEKRIDSKKASLKEIFFQKGYFFPLSMESPFRSFHNMILLSFMLLSAISCFCPRFYICNFLPV